MLQQDELRSRIVWAEQVARIAGTMMLSYAGAGKVAANQKLDKTAVTEGDLAINDKVIELVTKAYPNDGVRGEERSAHEDRNGLWICDPIDNTDGFIRHLTGAMFSMGYAVDGVPLVAVMYEPRLNLMYTAIKGGGSYENGIRLDLTKTRRETGLFGADIAFSPSYKQVKQRTGLYDALIDAGAKLIPVNGAAYKGALVATGMADALLFAGRSAHDTVAVKLVVEEAGGRVTDLRGKELNYSDEVYGVIATNGSPQLHAELVAAVHTFGPENYIGY